MTFAIVNVFPRPRDAEQSLVGISCPEPFDEPADRLGLIARRLVVGLKIERSALH